MSTVISSAYKFEGSIMELQAELFKLRKEVTTFINEDLTSEAQRFLARLVEFSTTMSEKEFMERMEFVFPEEFPDNMKKDTYIYSMCDMYTRYYMKEFINDQTIIVYPYSENMFYICPFGVKYLKTCLNNNPKFEDFSYWDNTDHPEEISYEDWEARGVVWDEIFENTDTVIFKDAGFSFEIFPEHIHIFQIMDVQIPETLEQNIRINPKFRKDEDFTIRKLYLTKLQDLIAK